MNDLQYDVAQAAKLLRSAGWSIDDMARVFDKPVSYVQNALARYIDRQPYVEDEITRLELSVRAERIVREAGAKTADDVVRLLPQISTTKGVGPKTVAELKWMLRHHLDQIAAG